MKTLKTLDQRVSYRLSRSKRDVFLRDDFCDLADYDQIGRSLRHMVEKGKLIKIGYGLYAKTKNSRVSSNPIPIKPLPSLARDALKALGVKVIDTDLARAYGAGATTQIPTGRVIGISGRISRKIGYDGKFVKLASA